MRVTRKRNLVCTVLLVAAVLSALVCIEHNGRTDGDNAVGATIQLHWDSVVPFPLRIPEGMTAESLRRERRWTYIRSPGAEVCYSWVYVPAEERGQEEAAAVLDGSIDAETAFRVGNLKVGAYVETPESGLRLKWLFSGSPNVSHGSWIRYFDILGNVVATQEYEYADIERGE